MFSSWTGATVGNAANPNTTITVSNAPLTVQANYVAVPSLTPTPTATYGASNTPSVTPSTSYGASASVTPTRSTTPTPTVTQTQQASLTPTPSQSVTPSITSTPSQTPANTPSPTPTPSSLGPLVVTVDYSSVSGNITNNSCANAITTPVTVTSVTNGSGSYSYSWTINNGNITIVTPTSISSRFEALVCCPSCGDQSQVGNITVTVTDNVTGQTGTAFSQAIISNLKSSGCVCF